MISRGAGWERAAAAIGVGAALLVSTGWARAQDEWKEDQGEKPPPDDRPAKKPEGAKDKDPAAPVATAAATTPTKLLVDLKIGPAFILASKFGGSRGATEFGLQVNLGYAIARDLGLKGDTFYLTVSPNLLVGSDLALIAPLGVQYDLPLTMVPYEGLYAYARASFGYAFYQPPFSKIDNGIHSFAAQPALGARLTFSERFHVGIEPFGLTILRTFPAKSTGNTEDTIVAFQIAILGGARF